jgi:two-component system nitrogen regulation sensor histidine kinase NtrY
LERHQKANTRSLKQFFHQILKKHLYLLVGAAWLLTIAVIINTYIDSPSSTKVIRNAIEDFLQDREKDFISIVADTALIRQMSNRELNDQQIEKLVNKRYGILVYEPRNFDGTWSLQFWNNQYVVANDQILQMPDSNNFQRLENGYYEVVKRTVFLPQKGSIIVLGMIPVRWEYYIPFTNLPNVFVGNNYAENKVKITNQETDLPIKSRFGQTLFHLERIQVQETSRMGWVTIVFIITGVLLILYFIQQVASEISSQITWWRGILFLISSVLFLRAFTYLFPDVLYLRRFELFDPTIFASSFLMGSLGDLLINSFLFCWTMLFVRRELHESYFLPSKNKILQWIKVAFTLIVLVGATFYIANLIRSLITDAKISFNVTNFFSLSVYSVVGFIVLACLALGYFYLSQILLQVIEPSFRQYPLLMYVMTTTMGLLLVSFTNRPGNIQLNLFVMVWLLLYMWLLHQKIFGGMRFKLSASEVLFWLFVFSLSVSFVIIYENKRREFEERKRLAEKLFFQTDPTSERKLSIALTYFDNDFLYPNFNRFKSRASNQFLKDSLANRNFSAYQNDFENHIYTFDSLGKPLFNENPVSFDTLNTIFTMTGKPTSIENLRFFEKSFDRFAYVFKKEITDTLDKKVGYLFVLSEPQKYKSDALVPELFRQRREITSDYSPVYSYAIYNNGDLIDYFNDYPFATQLPEKDIPKKEFYQHVQNGYDELWYRYSKDKVVVIVKKDNSLLEGITLFAYIFSAFLFLLASFRAISILIQSRMQLRYLKQYWQLNIRSQIHTTIIFISLFSFVVIGIATIFFFINRYNRNNQDRLTRAIQIMNKEIATKTRNHEAFDDVLKLYETGSNNEIKKLVDEVAEIHGADINLYDLNGNLRETSHPIVYDKGILSKKMNAEAYYKLYNKQMVQFVNEEQIGMVSYLSVYCPVRDEQGNAYAFLNIPSFNSQKELTQEISNFLVTIINLNVFIFLIAGAIALFITNRITSSFTLIGEKMQRINLGKLNEEIKWERNDEIGGLVKQYNTMVHKLEDSAAALAKSEREGAWRQMARQVAHEIKNPLTPMKLSIQYLQKAIDNNNSNVKEMTANVARTLIEQIDHLSKIASDFSQFANIGNIQNEVFDLHDVIASITSLYEATEGLNFTWHRVQQRIMMMMDRTQINRLFTNLLQNAIEASHSRDEKLITIDEQLEDDYILISISDNGEGIPESTQEKIFMPNFTTKSSGTGLGLAMSKAIVEQAKGSIWFETTEDEGTTFFIRLPILRAMS